MTPAQIRALVSIIFTVIVAAMVALAVIHYLNLRAAAASNEARGAKIETTGGILEDGQEEQENRQLIEEAVNKALAQYNRELRNAMAEDPTLVERDSRPVPERLRELARERRLARERSGSVDARSQEHRNTQDTAER